MNILQTLIHSGKAVVVAFVMGLLMTVASTCTAPVKSFSQYFNGGSTGYGFVFNRVSDPSFFPTAVSAPAMIHNMQDSSLYAAMPGSPAIWKKVMLFRDTIELGRGLIKDGFGKYIADTGTMMTWSQATPIITNMQNNITNIDDSLNWTMSQLASKAPQSTTYTKAECDALFYSTTNPSFYISTETDPIWNGVKSQYKTKIQNDSLYQPLGSYLTSEIDPTVPAYVKAITTTEKSNWNTAYGWGNHNGLYPLLSGSYTNPSWITTLDWSKIINKPTTLVGYGITDGVTSSTLSSTLSNYVLSSTYTSGLAGKENAITAGTTGQYWRGDKTWQTLDKTAVGLSNVDNTSDATKNSATVTLTNKTINASNNTLSNIGNAALVNSSFTINGSNVALGGSVTITAAPSIGAPTAGTAITSGVAFQPRSGGPCSIIINSSLGSGVAAVTGTITIAMSSTSGGTYTTVTNDGLILSLLSATLDRSSATIMVPTGWWVKVTTSTVGLGATITSTYTKWDY